MDVLVHRNIVLISLVLFASKSYQTILVQEYCHRFDNTGDQDVDAEVEFVPFPQSWLLDVLLDNEIGVFLYGLWCLYQIIFVTSQLACIPRPLFFSFLGGFCLLACRGLWLLFEFSLVVNLRLTVHESGVITLLCG